MMERTGVSTMPRFVPVEAKLRCPAPRDDLVPRRVIIDRLVDSADVPVVLVTAPPGFGKTVAVAQWDAADPRPFAWVSLDDRDDDSRVFLSYVTGALQRIGVVDTRPLPPAVDDPSAPVADRLGWLIDVRRPFVLVLDGTDAVKSPAVYEVVTWLVDHVPPGSQVVLIGRAAPSFEPASLEWDRLRSENRLVEVSTEDLRLSKDEGTLLVELAGAHLPPGAVDRLLEETEGWAAGLYLAVLRADVNDAGIDPDALGSDSVVADYVRDEILHQLSSADQVFLRRSSILTELSAPLCDVVLETSRSTETLRRLAREDIVTPDGARSGWYRIRHLVAEVMQAELTRQEPRLVKPLHARASIWFEKNGDVDDAIRYAIAGRSVERCARLVWKRAPACLAAGQISTVNRWLEAFTRQEVVSHAKLALTAAWCALARGLPADHWISAAERGRYDATRPGESASAAAAIAVLHAIVARNGAVQMSAEARLAMSLRGDDDDWICTAEFLDSVATYLAGGVDEARGRLEGVERHAAANGDHPVRAAALAEFAMISLAEGDWMAAAERTEQASGLVRAFNLDDVSLVMLVPCIRALLAVHAGRRFEAEARARSCARALALVVQLPPWLDIQCRQVLARTYLMLDDAAATRTLLSEAQMLLRSVPDGRVLHNDVYALWRQVEQLPIDVERGASALSTAELRVLQLLPTYLSFEEIGRELFVSRNTVKTQAIAAYRKLGVTSRSQAVERAYRIGLIPPTGNGAAERALT